MEPEDRRYVSEEIFVFGSNLAGRHGLGAALHARKYYEAEYGVGVGRTGNAYAIPTKDFNLKTLSIYRIASYVSDFLTHARINPDWTFRLTRIGCGLAGYTDEQIAPLFKGASDNVIIPPEWLPYIKPEEANAKILNSDIADDPFTERRL